MTALSYAVRTALLSAYYVSRITSVLRSTSLFSQGQAADALYFIDDGLIKLTRTNERGGRIILAIHGPGHLVGEEAMAEGSHNYYTEAEVLSTANLLRISREALTRAVDGDCGLMSSLTSYLLNQKLALAEKVELLCLHDVEYRILHYLAELSALVKPSESEEAYQLPITQLELADLVGATRETTSTTLNQLERRGLVKLSRRLLTIPSPVVLRNAALAKVGGHNGNAAHS